MHLPLELIIYININSSTTRYAHCVYLYIILCIVTKREFLNFGIHLFRLFYLRTVLLSIFVLCIYFFEKFDKCMLISIIA